jgi:hypothetical protein
MHSFSKNSALLSLGFPNQPSDHPSVDEKSSYELYELKSHRKIDGCWQLLAVYEDNNNLFKPYEEWGNLKDVFTDCIDNDNQDSNLTILYIKDTLAVTCPKELRWEVAVLAKKSIKFFLPNESDSEDSSDNSEREDIAESNNISTTSSCGNLHDSVHGFKIVDTHYYFEKGRKYHGVACCKCTKAIIGKICSANPAYVCPNFDLNKVMCKHIACTKCHTAEALSQCSGTRRSRTAASRGPQS